MHAPEPERAAHQYPPAKTGWQAVMVLTILYWFGTLDRQVAALLLPMIKADLQLSDIQVSLIQGLAFGLAFMLMSLPVGWLVDRISRRLVLFTGVIAWSLAAMGSGLSRSFGQLFVARAVVGGGESAINPTAYAMLSDMFPAGKLALPLSIFTLGGNLGSGASFMLGGAVIAWISTGAGASLPMFGALNGWQLAFLITGAPGLLLAVLIWTIPEQPRQRTRVGSLHSTFRDLYARYRQHPRFYITHNLGFAMVMSFVVGLQSWNSTYLSRHFDWKLSDIGYWMGLTQICSALAGLAFHGWAVDRLYSAGRKDAHLIYFATMCALACPCAVAAYMVDSAVGMLIFYNLAYFLIMAFASIGPAALQIATPPWLRGKASAVYMIVLSLLGTILGPIGVASLTDYAFRDEAQLGHSMAVFGGLTAALAAILFLMGRAPMRRAIEAITEQNPA